MTSASISTELEGDPEKRVRQLSVKAMEAHNSKLKTRSEGSYKSITSSKLSITLALKQAKAEAARVRVKFVEQEAEILKEKNELDIKLKLLQVKKEAAEAKAEVEALEASVCGSDGHLSSIPSIDPADRTANFVEQAVINDALKLNPTAAEFDPYVNTNTNSDSSRANITNEFTRFLLKKDLLLSRLYHFTDRPETYRLWKASFKSIVTEMELNPFEELDLIIKWLGPDSHQYATNIRAANADNPSTGLQRVWERLEQRFGSPEILEDSIKKRVESFPVLTNKDNKRLYELVDLMSEIESIKQNETFAQLFAYYDSSSGVLPIVNKLPYSLKEKWIGHAANYKKRHNIPFPPFSIFVDFIKEMCIIKNDPSLCYDIPLDKIPQKTIFNKPTVFTKKTEVYSEDAPTKQKICPLHNTKHSLNSCRAFRDKTIDERRTFIRKNNLCFRCCESTYHRARDCKVEVSCSECKSDKHPTALHITYISRTLSESGTTPEEHTPYGGESSKVENTIINKCTQICGSSFPGKSCAKIVLVKVHRRNQPEKSVKMYAIIDDQSNHSLAKTEFFDLLQINSEAVTYNLNSCSGKIESTGRVANDCVVKTIDGKTQLNLPPLLECQNIPEIKEEIPTPEVAAAYSHMKDLVSEIPQIDINIKTLLLIGRDLVEAHHVYDQRIGPRHSPFAQKLALGWVIVGEVCLGNFHKSKYVNVNKTYLLSDGRTSLFTPCYSSYNVKHPIKEFEQDSVFQLTKEDNKPGLSIDDRKFINIMNNEFYKNRFDKWTAPLPFRPDKPKLPNNRSAVQRRAKILGSSLSKDTAKRQLFLKFMEKVFQSGHAEKAPNLLPEEECWYLPIFGVFHPQKPGRVRCVFDSSAKQNNISLNDVLITGPDLTNSLLGILLRFRKEAIAITADIEHMFYCFYVHEDYRNFLRFFWYKDNDPRNEMIEYRMCVHVFGNSPSPAIATYGLRKTVENSELDVKKFVTNNFYVDDALTSLSTASEAVSLMKRTQSALKHGGLNLHKVVSNSKEVMRQFSPEKLDKSVKNLDPGNNTLPMQRSLGLQWDLNTDTFTFSVKKDQKPFTRRGVLSVINSIFDPIGFLAPVTIQGKLILKDLITSINGWDDPLNIQYLPKWESWKESLSQLQYVHIPRTYLKLPWSTTKKEVHIFSDASEQTIAAVAYLITSLPNETSQIGFVMGKAKIAPSSGHTIPRLELCAAVIATEIAETISYQLDIPLESFKFYTDSKVVLGYIGNQTRRFHTYVSNRVEKIRRSSEPKQWRYIPTNLNPADCATRYIHAKDIRNSVWLKGPIQFFNFSAQNIEPIDIYPLVHPEGDTELKQDFVTLKVEIKRKSCLGSSRFARFSSWRRLVEAIARLTHIATSFSGIDTCKKWHLCSVFKSVEHFQEAETLIIRVVQHETYGKELEAINQKKSLPKESHILKLDPFLDEYGILRVGGRLNKSNIPSVERNPIIVPAKHHIAILLVRLHHTSVQHQGRHITEGAIRSAGLWIVGGKRLISSIIFKCVVCRKLRGKFVCQKMADLPSDRLEQAAPFTYVGVDTFGPWQIVARRTRGGFANSKRWAILFTCLTIRAIHIEVVESLSSSAFINALRRFLALRGTVKEFRSDRGTNFVGACEELQMNAIQVERGEIQNYLYNKGTVWKFNSPHSSHMGGVWERMIGIARRILEPMLCNEKNLTHEVLITVLAEVTAIVNSRPLVPVSYDSEVPEIISPNKLLTLKSDLDVQPSEIIETQNLYKFQWQRVKHLANIFWNRWRKEFLQSLQSRRKWHNVQDNIQEGDLVLLKDKDVGRVCWPVARIKRVFPDSDGKVRKVEVSVIKENGLSNYIRPIVDLVLLMRN